MVLGISGEKKILPRPIYFISFSFLPREKEQNIEKLRRLQHNKPFSHTLCFTIYC